MASPSSSEATPVPQVSFLDAVKARYGAEDDLSQYDAAAFLVGDPSRKRNKTWEMVGFEKTRQKQSRYDRLVQVVVRDSGINVAVKDSEKKKDEEEKKAVVTAEEEGNSGASTTTKPSANASKDALAEANMVRLQELDLSENVSLPLSEVGKLMPYFPSLVTLQVSDCPTLLLLPTNTTTGTCAAAAEATPHTPLPRPLLVSKTLKKLVFNSVGFHSLFQLRALVEVPQLEELHLDGNGIEHFALFANEAERKAYHERVAAEDSSTAQPSEATSMTGGWLCFPHVKTLSLAHNRLHAWGSPDAVEGETADSLGHTLLTAFPSLQALYLTDNALPNLRLPDDIMSRASAMALSAATGKKVDGVAEPSAMGKAAFTVSEEHNELLNSPSLAPYRFLRSLRVLCLNDNLTLTHPATVDAVRVLCPSLDVFRITYATILPQWNETLSRMYVVASLPTITMLNRGQVRPKERLDSEIFYVQRGLAQREGEEETKRQQPVEGSVETEPAYPLLDALREKHKDLVISIYREGTTASSDEASGAHMMLNVILRCENSYVAKGGKRGESGGAPQTEVQRTLPSSLTVARLKALLRMVFQIDLPNQAINYRSGDAGVLQRPIELDNEVQTLAYYGVCNGAIITVRDTSLR